MSANQTLNLVQEEIGGGRISKEKIDVINSSKFSSLKVSGLTQDTFEYLIEKYGDRFVSIEFWKCPLVHDLTPLETLTKIESISYYWNQRAETLWDMSKNKCLSRFAFEDFTRVKSLEQINCAHLKELTFGNIMHVTQQIESLEPLRQLHNLQKLEFCIKKVEDGRVEPLSNIRELKSLNFPLNLFSTEKIAWLTARIGGKVQSRCLAPCYKIETPLRIGAKLKDTLIVGKGKPFLDGNIDREKIRQHEKKFELLVSEYRADPNINEPA